MSPGPWAEAAYAALSLVGVDGPVHPRSAWLGVLTGAVGLSFGTTAAVTASYLLLRTFEPAPMLPQDDQHRIRELLARWGAQDSLGYFALRPDKSVVFSPTGKAAVSYRVLAGVALASGDPLGDPEAWPGAMREFLRLCEHYAWIPAALGCSERGAHAWSRHGLDALELGDEAVGPVARGWFTLLHLASRWWQIESLYRFNARFRPRWTPRFIAFPHFRTLPRVALAALDAEGFGGRPSALLRLLRRRG